MTIKNAHARLLERDDTVLLLVDVQTVLLEMCVDKERMIANCAAILDICMNCGIPVIMTVQNSPKLGVVVPELVSRIPHGTVYNKLQFSCFDDEPTAGAILDSGRRTLLVAGLETHVCILQTALEALQLGFCVHVAADGVTSRSHFNREIGLQRLGRAGVVISSTEMMIYELLKGAGTAEFRQALPLLKKLK
jgi:nicotinamidase-related amidase